MSQANFSDDAETVVEAIQNGVKTDKIEIDGQIFTTRPVFHPPQQKEVAEITVHSLEGLVEYLNKQVDEHTDEKLLIVINSPKSVSIYRQVSSRTDLRTEWLEAKYELEGFPFGRFHDHESFVIQAQTLIVETESRNNLLKYIGNLTTALVQTSVDDGISQTVTIEQGVRKSEIELPNPVVLAPRRTFVEVDQPDSPFVLRVKQSREGQMPEIALFEADGGLWKLAAIQNIKDYLKSELEAEIPIIG